MSPDTARILSIYQSIEPDAKHASPRDATMALREIVSRIEEETADLRAHETSMERSLQEAMSGLQRRSQHMQRMVDDIKEAEDRRTVRAKSFSSKVRSWTGREDLVLAGMNNALTAARDAKDLLSRTMDEEKAVADRLRTDLFNTRQGRPRAERERIAELGRARVLILRAIPWMADLPADAPVSLAEALDFALPQGDRPAYGATKPSRTNASDEGRRQSDEDRRRSSSDDMLPLTVAVAAAVVSSSSSTPAPDPTPSYDSSSSSSFDSGGGGF